MGRPTTTSSPGARSRRGYGARLRRHRGARLALVTSAALLLTLLFAASAEAAKPGTLLYAKRIGADLKSEANALAIAAGPKGVTALAGKQEKSGATYPMVAKYTSAGKRVWLRRYTAAGKGRAADVAFDRSGNVYVAATVYSGASADIVVLKYSAAGDLLWVTPPYDGGEKDYVDAAELAVDDKGDVVVVGQSTRAGGNGIVVLKYTKTGKPAWAEPTRWDPDPGNPKTKDLGAADLALDDEGDIYVAGSMSYVGFDTAAIWKARGSDGAKSGDWHYEPPHGDLSSFHALTVRGSSVVATGSARTEGVERSENALIVKFDRGLQEKASKEWGVDNKSGEWFRAAVIDGKGSVFVTGEQWAMKCTKAVTMKLDAKLRTVWSRKYKPASRDAAVGEYIARDGAGNVYVGGFTSRYTSTKAAFLTIKYSATGALRWVRAWAPGGGSANRPAGLVLGSKGGVYVGGWAKSKGGVDQAVLLKYRR